MSKYLDDNITLILTIVKGNATDPAVTAAVQKLSDRLDADEATDADVKASVDALIKQLANAPAVPTAVVA